MDKKVPFDFVFDYLRVEVVVKPMFGSFGVYVGDKIVLILRQKGVQGESNGVWVATSPEFHAGLKKELPSLCSISLLSNEDSVTQWQMIPETADDFESEVIKLCELITRGDERIGRIPKKRKVRSKK